MAEVAAASIGLSWAPKLPSLSAASGCGSSSKKGSAPAASVGAQDSLWKPRSDGLFVPPRDPRKINKLARKNVTGKGWFDMPAPTITPELKKDLEILQLPIFYPSEAQATTISEAQAGNQQCSTAARAQAGKQHSRIGRRGLREGRRGPEAGGGGRKPAEEGGNWRRTTRSGGGAAGHLRGESSSLSQTDSCHDVSRSTCPTMTKASKNVQSDAFPA